MCAWTNKSINFCIKGHLENIYMSHTLLASLNMQCQPVEPIPSVKAAFLNEDRLKEMFT